MKGVATFDQRNRVAELAKWQSFYVIVGSSGAALIGVQFVMVALIANMRMRTTAESISAFGTPTVVHFGGSRGTRAE